MTQTQEIAKNNEEIIQTYFSYAGISSLSPIENRSILETVKETPTSYTYTKVDGRSASLGMKTYSYGELWEATAGYGSMTLEYRYKVDNYFNGSFVSSRSGYSTTFALAQAAMKGAMKDFANSKKNGWFTNIKLSHIKRWNGWNG
jgi:hypothetical protein